ncbi:serine/threonine protein kinase [Cryobacterium sp. CAN_C3]|uniref:serine/threonine protein kinase n=1 Tax=unclassified Cryobacterium TaxID=2649013 RepID=UPI0018C92A2A|nr:serine/threonine-protein kinase [Cryobacterium sp. CAN_C3]MEC5154012.1 serine/threonine protein kinase [Cryobacterium sp. CAN_C3]
MPNHESLIIDGVTYELESALGQGGSAVVWKSRRRPDDLVFAVKRIRKDSNEGSARNKRFEQEIGYGQTANHPNVVKIHARSDDANFFYYVMDLYPMTLRNVISDEFDAEVLLDYTLQLCGALAYVHSGGIVHRDIKPENVLVDPDARRLVLADFGIAHFKDSALTERDDLLVNRNYLAPEQMMRNNAHGIGKPADVYSLGLIITEMFTKQNARGRRHALIRENYPFLADLDLIVEQMMLQDEGQRLRIDTVRGLIRMTLQRLNSTIEEIVDELRPNELPAGVSPGEVERILGRAARDVLSARQVFERVTDQELGRYNLNYHCEIEYQVSPELFNTCAQAVVYAQCKAKFDYEGAGRWDEPDDSLVSSVAKPALLRELELILDDFPLLQSSLWDGLPRQSTHLFRFLKDYHCNELLTRIRASVYGQDADSLRVNLIGAPILWIARCVRGYLDTDYLKLDNTVREEIGFERHLSVLWSETLPLDSAREATGAKLLSEPFNADDVALTLKTFEAKWDVSVGELPKGDYSVMFRAPDEYRRFHDEALALAEPGSVFEADVLNLLRPEAEFDDLVALTWDRDFDVAITLGKIMGTHSP